MIPPIISKIVQLLYGVFVVVVVVSVVVVSSVVVVFSVVVADDVVEVKLDVDVSVDIPDVWVDICVDATVVEVDIGLVLVYSDVDDVDSGGFGSDSNNGIRTAAIMQMTKQMKTTICQGFGLRCVEGQR